MPSCRILLAGSSTSAAQEGLRGYAALQARPGASASIELRPGPDGWVELRFPTEASRWHFHNLAVWLSAPVGGSAPRHVLLLADEPSGVSYWLAPGSEDAQLSGATSDGRALTVDVPTGRALPGAPNAAPAMTTAAMLLLWQVPSALHAPLRGEPVERVDLPLVRNDARWLLAPAGPPGGTAAAPSALGRLLGLFTGR